jgi:hypothetical protein
MVYISEIFQNQKSIVLRKSSRPKSVHGIGAKCETGTVSVMILISILIQEETCMVHMICVFWRGKKDVTLHKSDLTCTIAQRPCKKQPKFDHTFRPRNSRLSRTPTGTILICSSQSKIPLSPRSVSIPHQT